MRFALLLVAVFLATLAVSAPSESFLAANAREDNNNVGKVLAAGQIVPIISMDIQESNGS